MNDETPDDAGGTPTESAWIDAPASSHLQAFRFVDNSRPGSGAPSELYVTFRPGQPRKDGYVRPAATYRYVSHDHAALRQTYENMRTNASPGTVLHEELIARGNKGSPV